MTSRHQLLRARNYLLLHNGWLTQRKTECLEQTDQNVR